MGQLRAFHRTYLERIICFLNAVGAVAQLVEYRTRNQELGCAGSTHTRSTASNLEQVANLLCAKATEKLSAASGRRHLDAAWIAGQDRSMWRTLRPSAGQAQH